MSARSWTWLALALPLALGPAWLTLSARVPTWPLPGTLAGLVLLLLLGTCAATDAARGRIPNAATYPAFLWALLINGPFLSATRGGRGIFLEAPWLAAGSLGAIGLGPSLAGAVTCFGLMLAIYRIAGRGAGDVKLATGIGALIGPDRGLAMLINTYLIAAGFIVARSVLEVGPLFLARALLRRAGAWALPGWVAPPDPSQRRYLGRPVPLGGCFAAGTLAALAGLG